MRSAAIKRMLLDYKLNFADEILDNFVKYYDMLVETNKVMNLTAITDYNDVVTKHFSDSLSIFSSSKEFRECYNTKKSIKIIDIGTGAGFPGLPIKIVYPQAEVVLMDSLGKRITFLDSVITELGLEDIYTQNMRAEEAGTHHEYREAFDFCFCRAVAKLNIISEYALPLVKKGGYFIPYKSVDIDDEITEGTNAVSTLGGRIEEVSKIFLPATDIPRAHVIISKISPTPTIYPRPNAKIKKNPL